jgi:hypothetical protein
MPSSMRASHAMAYGGGGSLILAQVILFWFGCWRSAHLADMDMTTALAHSALILWAATALRAWAASRGVVLPPLGNGEGGAFSAGSPPAAAVSASPAASANFSDAATTASAAAVTEASPTTTA